MGQSTSSGGACGPTAPIASKSARWASTISTASTTSSHVDADAVRLGEQVGDQGVLPDTVAVVDRLAGVCPSMLRGGRLGTPCPVRYRPAQPAGADCAATADRAHGDGRGALRGSDWEPLVPPATFHAVQRTLDSPTVGALASDELYRRPQHGGTATAGAGV